MKEESSAYRNRLSVKLSSLGTFLAIKCHINKRLKKREQKYASNKECIIFQDDKAAII